MGPSPKAPFDIESDIAFHLLTASGNPTGQSNSNVIRPVASAIDIAQAPRGKWTIDFALMKKEVAVQYEAPFEYVKKNVLPLREGRRDDYRGMWWQYARPRPEMREALDGVSRFITTPAVSKHRIFTWMNSEWLCNQGTLIFVRSDYYFFGVLHSRLHEVWALKLGTRLETRPRYTPTTCFETFPFPPRRPRSSTRSGGAG